MRLFAISDIHTDIPANLEWVKQLDKERWRHDALIVAGDVTDNLAILEETFKLLKERFAEVFFIWGNHDIWDENDSLAKVDIVQDRLRKIGVRCEPYLLDGRVWVVPLESWYVFDDENEKHDLELVKLRMWRDFEKCSWTAAAVGSVSTRLWASFDAKAKLAESRAVARLMLERNEAVLERVFVLQSVRHLPVVTFSHFVPRVDLNPKTFRIKELRAVTVCPDLDSQIRSLRSSVHVFGHTHMRTNKMVEGVQYIQFPLGYPTEGAYCPRYSDISFNEVHI